jgi:nitrite reductase (NADH) small subunit
MTTLDADWVDLGPLDAIPKPGARVVRTADGDIAVFRTVDDEVYALRDRCPHRGGPLSQGIVHGKRVACPLHDWKIHLDSGEAVAPDEGCTPYYDTRVQDGTVYLCLTPRAPSGRC